MLRVVSPTSIPECLGVVGWLTRLEQSVRLPSRSIRNLSVLPIPGSVNPPSGGFSFLASVMASQTILTTARISLALRRAALADALRRSTLA